MEGCEGVGVGATKGLTYQRDYNLYNPPPLLSPHTSLSLHLSLKGDMHKLTGTWTDTNKDLHQYVFHSVL